MKTFKLTSNDDLTHQVLKTGIRTWNELLHYVQKLPYGRNKSRENLALVLSEQKGTCSTKHAFLKKIADLNDVSDVQLITGIYKMNHNNTPKIGTCLIEKGLNYIPEAHCYLNVLGKRIDITTTKSSFKTIEKAILQERVIQPEDVGELKVRWHQEFLRNWLKKQELNFSFNEIWAIREECIQRLSLETTD